MSPPTDQPLVLTLDAGGTNFSFAALRGGQRVAEPVVLPAEAHDLDRSLANLFEGFQRVAEDAGGQAQAISFAFPGPADYAAGVTYNVGNLPAYAGGVPLASILQERFDVPVWINNDGDLFALGEASFGRLSEINRRLEKEGSERRYRNLIGLTLGTGFGGGVVIDGRLLRGDTGVSGEVWLLRHGLRPGMNVEEGISIRAVTGGYGRVANDPQASERTPHDIARIAEGELDGDGDAARAAYAEFGSVLGDAIANLVTVLDGAVVLGGGLSKAHSLFMPALVEMTVANFSAECDQRRLEQCIYNLECHRQAEAFFCPTDDDPATRRIPIAVSQLGANEAVSRGAYAVAVQALKDQ